MRTSGIRLIFLCLFALFAACSATTNSSLPERKLRIAAIFGHMGKSHFDVFKPLLEELARRGHDVTVVSYCPRTEKAKAKEPLPNYKDISLLTENAQLFVDVVNLKDIDHSFLKIFKELFLLNYMASMGCSNGLFHPEVQELVRSGQKFDLVLTENFNTNCFMAVVHKLNAPFIQMSSHQLMAWTVEQLSISHEATYIPTLFTRASKPMNFFDRVFNVLTIWFTTTAFNTWFQWHDQSVAVKAFGPDVPNLREFSKNVSLIMVNTHYVLHGAQLFPPNVIELGGLHIPSKVNPLPKDVAQFLDNAHEGVLFFSLGSMVKMATIPDEMLNTLMNVLGSIPRKVIWKWETEDLPNKPSNVMIRKWLPQFDIMNHPNVKVYFGHGGLLGLSEGVHSGIPMLLLPLYGDQYQNSMAAKHRGVAIMLEFDNFNEQTLRQGLDELFNNTMYAENARKLSKAFRDRPASSLETAVWWTEYVARGHGVPYLRSDATRLNWYQRNLIDVALFLLAIAIIGLYAVYRAARYLLSRREKPRSQTNGVSTKKRD